jgi:hypothetical protein
MIKVSLEERRKKKGRNKIRKIGKTQTMWEKGIMNWKKPIIGKKNPIILRKMENENKGKNM